MIFNITGGKSPYYGIYKAIASGAGIYSNGSSTYSYTSTDVIHGGMPEGDYAEATDPISMNRTYIETDIPIESETEDSLSPEDLAYAEAGRILMGYQNDY